MIGQQLAHYEITAKLGEGGMGEVYRTTHTKLAREVALKILPAAMSNDTERLERFEREAQTVAALNHSNIVTIHSVEEDHGRHFLTMELVDGEPLDQVNGLGVDVRPFAFCVAFGASASFLSPIGYQTNTLVYGPGGYRFTDYLKVGFPISLSAWLLATLLIPVFWPF